MATTAMRTESQTTPLIALAMGDPAGISPELTARVIMDAEVRAAARLIVIGDRRILDEGARVAGLTLDVVPAATESDAIAAATGERSVMLDLGHLALTMSAAARRPWPVARSRPKISAARWRWRNGATSKRSASPHSTRRRTAKPIRL